MTRTPQEEVDANYQAFRLLLPSILATHRGKYALMKDEKILGYYSSPVDAREAADLAIKDGLFSIQYVSDVAISLGYFTDAVLSVPLRP